MVNKFTRKISPRFSRGMKTAHVAVFLFVCSALDKYAFRQYCNNMEHPLLTAFIKSYLANTAGPVEWRTVKQAYQSEFIGKPGNILLCGDFQMSEQKLIQMKPVIQGLRNKMVNVAPIIDYRIESDDDKNWPSGYMLCECAPGGRFDNVLWLKMFNDIPQESIDKLVYDANVIRGSGLVIDSAGPNLFYDVRSKVFTFIDLIPNSNFRKLFRQAHCQGARYAKFFDNMIGCRDVGLGKAMQRMLYVDEPRWKELKIDINARIDLAIRNLPQTTELEAKKYREHCDAFARHWNPANMDYAKYFATVQENVAHMYNLAGRNYAKGE